MFRVAPKILCSRQSLSKRCRPAVGFDILNIRLRDNSSPIVESSKWPDLNENSTVRLASVPIITNFSIVGKEIGLGDLSLLFALLDKFNIPHHTLDPFLDDRISFTVFPHNDAFIYQLCFRQWSMVWTSSKSQKQVNAVLFWVAGSWARNIALAVPKLLLDFDPFPKPDLFPGLLASAVNLQNVAASLTELDHESYRTERRLRDFMRTGRLEFASELGSLSAEYNWIAARAIRERVRTSNVQTFLEFLNEANDTTGLSTRTYLRFSVTDQSSLILPLQMLTSSLFSQASKLCEESNMHLATLYNLIAQRDSAANLAIAASAKEIALQSRIDQTVSLQIAESSKKIAEEAKRDSTAMKMIAYVTMVYLPGTFLASCFAMPLFTWDAPSSGVVNPRIWVYFVVTALLTAMTILAFAGWLSRKNKEISGLQAGLNQGRSHQDALDSYQSETGHVNLGPTTNLHARVVESKHSENITKLASDPSTSEKRKDEYAADQDSHPVAELTQDASVSQRQPYTNWDIFNGTNHQKHVGSEMKSVVPVTSSVAHDISKRNEPFHRPQMHEVDPGSDASNMILAPLTFSAASNSKAI